MENMNRKMKIKRKQEKNEMTRRGERLKKLF